MGRIFRAFVWMRLRVLVNSLERTGARDTLERFSVATEKLGPIIALVLLIPSSIVLFVLGITTGFALAMGDSIITITLVRFFLLLVLALTLIGPIVLPTRDSGSIVRLLLLPIPRFDLYLAQLVGTLADPWILLLVPVMIGVPIGFAVGLKFVASLLALVAGTAFLLFIVGLTSFSSSLIHLLMRDRRRSDLVMLIVVFLIPMFAILPQLLIRERAEGGRRLTHAERRALPPSKAELVIRRIAPYVPSEMYRRTAQDVVAAPAAATIPLAELALLGLVVQGVAFAAYRRVLDMPVSLGTRRAATLGLWDRVVPGLSPAASAVAFTQLRLVLRTPRGRASLITPLLVPLMLGALAYRRGGGLIPGMETQRGLALGGIGAFAAILAQLPIVLNQFAIDRAGFTRQMLSPISIGELLKGKAVGNALVAAVPGGICILLALLAFPIGRPSYWLALLVALVSTYALFAPVAAALSAVFPKTVDLNSIGNSSNAHQAAGLLGMLTFAAAAAPSILLALLATQYLHRPELVILFLAGWCAIAIALGAILFIPIRKLVANRCETLAQHY